jgi:proteic killer suppression protein
MQLPAVNCHALSGDRKGEWAVTISANHRLIFEIAHEPIPLKGNDSVDAIRVTDIRITGTTDYH